MGLFTKQPDGCPSGCSPNNPMAIHRVVRQTTRWLSIGLFARQTDGWSSGLSPKHPVGCPSGCSPNTPMAGQSDGSNLCAFSERWMWWFALLGGIEYDD